MTAHLNGCTGNCDAGPQDVDAFPRQASGLTPAQTSVGTNQHHGFVLVGHGVDQLVHLRLGEESRRLKWLRRQRHADRRVDRQSAVSNRRIQTLAKREDSFADSRGREAGGSHLRTQLRTAALVILTSGVVRTWATLAL